MEHPLKKFSVLTTFRNVIRQYAKSAKGSNGRGKGGGIDSKDGSPSEEKGPKRKAAGDTGATTVACSKNGASSAEGASADGGGGGGSGGSAGGVAPSSKRPPLTDCIMDPSGFGNPPIGGAPGSGGWPPGQYNVGSDGRADAKQQTKCGKKKKDPLPGKPHSNSAHIYRTLSLFGILPFIIAFSAWQIYSQKHKERPEWVPYTYLAKRDKRFAWGDGNKSLFHNKFWNALPDGYEFMDDDELIKRGIKNKKKDEKEGKGA